MKWYTWMILIGVVGLIFAGGYYLLETPTTVINDTNVHYDNGFTYYIKVEPMYGSKVCPYEYSSYNGAVLVDQNGTPINISYNEFVGVNGHYANMKVKTCTCDSFYANLTHCRIGEPVYQNMTVFVITNYKVIKPTGKFACKTNSDCVPATCCHPTVCVNKAFKPNCTNAICTMSMVPGTLDYGKCGCVNGTCVAEIQTPISFE